MVNRLSPTFPMITSSSSGSELTSPVGCEVVWDRLARRPASDLFTLTWSFSWIVGRTVFLPDIGTYVQLHSSSKQMRMDLTVDVDRDLWSSKESLLGFPCGHIMICSRTFYVRVLGEWDIQYKFDVWYEFAEAAFLARLSWRELPMPCELAFKKVPLRWPDSWLNLIALMVLGEHRLLRIL